MLRLRISRLEGVAIAVLAVVITGVLVVKRFVRNDSADVLPQRLQDGSAMTITTGFQLRLFMRLGCSVSTPTLPTAQLS